MTGSAVLLRGVDLAAFAVALVTRARRAGVDVSASGAARFTEALRVLPPTGRRRLYWTARVSLVGRHTDIERFDAVFAAVFDDAVLALDPAARASAPHTKRTRAGGGADDGSAAPGPRSRGAPPWATLDATAAPPPDPGGGDETTAVTLRLPSPIEAIADEPFGLLRDDDLRRLGRWLEQTEPDWPRRPGRRHEPHRHGRVDLRATIRRARGTGFEPVRLVRCRPRERRRRIVLLCDVSRSMHGYADVYVHLMRAAVVRGNAEVFAFSTHLTRLTPVLAHRSADVAVARASERVVDRFGGTHIAGSLAALLSSPHGSALRGAVVIVASDGWDSDDPADLARAVARIHRRAHRVVWLNPRAGAAGFEPTAGSMAAALPHCDDFLSAHTVAALGEMLTTVARNDRVARARARVRGKSDRLS
ncbi:VWA domain-containing protein [Prescottella defluvii]|uniref:vWA domain-containing protein n=1 Tax=Prescottella defluvii TaxID=1323361 RepID=UPI0004F24A69|nr:VWA domain-containing protein [Prescottella defluvii]